MALRWFIKIVRWAQIHMPWLHGLGLDWFVTKIWYYLVLREIKRDSTNDP